MGRRKRKIVGERMQGDPVRVDCDVIGTSRFLIRSPSSRSTSSGSGSFFLGRGYQVWVSEMEFLEASVETFVFDFEFEKGVEYGAAARWVRSGGGEKRFAFGLRIA